MSYRSWWSAGIVALAIGSGACHARPPAVPAPAPSVAPAAPARPPMPPPPPPRPAESPAVPAPAAPSEEELFSRLSLSQLNDEHPLGDAFFDYDQATLRDDARTSLQKDADWLLKWKQTSIQVAGHCDERGTAEYNLALGNRRAGAVRDYLVSLGVGAQRIKVTSLGKEAPFCRGATESCWSQNRRGHFVITGK